MFGQAGPSLRVNQTRRQPDIFEASILEKQIFFRLLYSVKVSVKTYVPD